MKARKTKTFTKFILLLPALLLAACSGIIDYNQNLKKWQDAGIEHYRYSLHIGCFCPFRNYMPLSIEVKDGEVVSMDRADGTPILSDNQTYKIFEPYSTLDRLFAQLKAALTGGNDEVRVTYDSAYGFPDTIYIDRIKEAVDDEISFSVKDFEVLE